MQASRGTALGEHQESKGHAGRWGGTLGPDRRGLAIRPVQAGSALMHSATE